MRRFCTGACWTCALFCCVGFGVYQLVVLGETCVGSSYPAVPCLCTWLVGTANVLVPCTVISFYQTKGPFLCIVGAKVLAYVLAARFAVDFALDDVRTRLLLVDLLVSALLAALTLVAISDAAQRREGYEPINAARPPVHILRQTP